MIHFAPLIHRFKRHLHDTQTTHANTRTHTFTHCEHVTSCYVTSCEPVTQLLTGIQMARLSTHLELNVANDVILTSSLTSC